MKMLSKLAVLCLSVGLAFPAVAAPSLSVNSGSRSGEVATQSDNAWLEIDTKAFEDNIATLQKLLDGKSQICAILKADAYGNSIDLLMPSIIKMQVPCVGIASNEEVRIIRQHGYRGRVMRVRSATIGEIAAARRFDVEELFGNQELAEAAAALPASGAGKLRFHLGLNSAGMDRNGLDLTTDRGKQAALAIVRNPRLQLVGIMTHFPVEEAADVRRGLARFNSETDWLIRTARLDRRKLVLHVANSFSTLAVPESRLDMVRPGGLLYGDTIPEHTEYRKVMAFKTRVSSVNNYLKGSTVGYDRTFTLTRDSRLANLPIGYSDGYRRAFTNKGHVLIRGHRVPVVGKISMNTTMVDVTDFPDIVAGDEVVLYGKQGGAEITQSEIEEISGALLADLYTVWGNSNPRVRKPGN